MRSVEIFGDHRLRTALSYPFLRASELKRLGLRN